MVMAEVMKMTEMTACESREVVETTCSYKVMRSAKAVCSSEMCPSKVAARKMSTAKVPGTT